MVDITGLVTLDAANIVGLLINVIVITVVIALSDKIIAHEMSIIHSLIMAFVSYFVFPILLSYLNISFPLSGFVVPLLIWIGLGAVLLKGDKVTRLKVALIAFVINIVLTFAGISGMIAGLF